MGQPKNLQLGMESVVRDTEYLFGGKYASLQCIYSGFSAGFHSFRCVYSIFTCSGAFFLPFLLPTTIYVTRTSTRTLILLKKPSGATPGTPCLFWSSQPKAQKPTEAQKNYHRNFNRVRCAINNASKCQTDGHLAVLSLKIFQYFNILK